MVPAGPPSAEDIPLREEPPPGEERPEKFGETPTSPPNSREEPPPGEKWLEEAKGFVTQTSLTRAKELAPPKE